MARISVSFANVALLLAATSSFVVGNNWHDNKPSCRNIVELVCSNSNLSTLCSLVKQANLDEILSTNNNNDFTLFAPNNYAFKMLPDDAAEAVKDIKVLTDVLAYHVAGVELFFEDIDCKDKLKMFNGEFTTTKCIGEDTFQVGTGNTYNALPEIIDVDIEACNGVIHIVDQVILPGGGSSGSIPVYCRTYAPDKTCWKNGWPECCSNENIDCPYKQPTCDNDNHNDNWVGDDFCTYSLDYDCYKNGRPSCCGNKNIECPYKQPTCDYNDHNDNWVGDDYCTYSFDYDCYKNGRPSCCGNKNVDCPYKQPTCDDNDHNGNWVGDDFCTYTPDYDCYEYGRPLCCGNKNLECSYKQPACDYDNYPHKNPSSGGCQTIADLVCSSSHFEVLCAAVKILGLGDTLTDDVFTVFAPMDSAFEELLETSNPMNALKSLDNDTLLDLILFHTVSNKKVYFDDLDCNGVVTMATKDKTFTTCGYNDSIKFQYGKGNHEKNLPRIVGPDKKTCNGVVHSIDVVMLPYDIF